MANDLEQSIMDSLYGRLKERQRSKMQNPNVGREWTRRQIQDAFIETFELIGGVPRLALWANDPENYTDFLRLLMKLAPKETVEKAGTVINFLPSTPDSELNYPQPDQPRGVIEHDDSMEESI